jgi:hypothetical protein
MACGHVVVCGNFIVKCTRYVLWCLREEKRHPCERDIRSFFIFIFFKISDIPLSRGRLPGMQGAVLVVGGVVGGGGYSFLFFPRKKFLRKANV